MQFLLLTVMVSVVAFLIPAQIYADSDHVVSGNGFGIIDGSVKPVSLQLNIQIPQTGSVVFQDGTISIGNQAAPIKSLSLSMSNNKKIINLNANADDLTLNALGKLVTSTKTDSVYHVSGKTSKGIISIFVKLGQTISSEESISKKNLLLLVKQTDRVEWKSPYKFTVRTFDPQINTKSDFYSNSGYLEGVSISAIITNPVGDVIKRFDGVTQKFGYYENSVIIPDNARTGIYKLNVTLTGKDYVPVKQEFTFVVFPSSSR